MGQTLKTGGVLGHGECRQGPIVKSTGKLSRNSWEEGHGPWHDLNPLRRHLVRSTEDGTRGGVPGETTLVHTRSDRKYDKGLGSRISI